ncbi:MAG: ribosome recycling factor [Phycisphaeraceae bacterium]|nr:ribosome recycling factor [Phycisphaeraceae bacterium]
MATDIDEVLLETEAGMEKAVEYLRNELRGIRTGRASTGLVEYVKVDYYGSETELRQLAMISVPEPTQILIKPFDPSSVEAIVKGLQEAGMGLNPMQEDDQVRINLPSLSGERREQMTSSVKEMGEQAKVAIRNTRRDGNKQVDAAAKDKANPISEDDVKRAKDAIQELVKKYEGEVELLVESKIKEIQDV